MHSGQGQQKQNLLIPLLMTFLRRKSESADMEEDCRVDETGIGNHRTVKENQNNNVTIEITSDF